MNTITHSQRYLPHEINTKFYAVKLYRSGVGVSFVCRRYHISKSSLLLSVKLDAPAPCRLDAPDLDLICYASADCLHQHLQVI